MVATVREFLYPMRNANKYDKTPLKIVAHIGGKVQVLHKTDDAAGEFRMQGLLQDRHIGAWYIQDGTLVIDIGSCPFHGVEYSGDKHVGYCSLCASRKIIDGKASIVYGDCRVEKCPLADRKGERT